jgi:DNA-binding XRE family transcriptional regulator
MSEVKTTSLAAFASQLKAWRKQSGLTQVDLAAKLGYSPSLVSGIETMDKPPRRRSSPQWRLPYMGLIHFAFGVSYAFVVSMRPSLLAIPPLGFPLGVPRNPLRSRPSSMPVAWCLRHPGV